MPQFHLPHLTPDNGFSMIRATRVTWRHQQSSTVASGGGGHSASEFDHGSGGTSRPLSPTGGAAKATPRAVNPHPVGTALSWWSRVDHAAASLTKVVAR